MLLIIIRLVSDPLEQKLHIFERACACLDVLNGLARIDPVRNHFFRLYFSLLFPQIAFVSYEDYWHYEVVISLGGNDALDEIGPPNVDGLVRLSVAEVENDHAAVSTSVERI